LAHKSRPPVDKLKQKLVKSAAEVIQYHLKYPGRPTIYHVGFCHLVERHTFIGATKTELAELLAVGGDSIDEWMRVHPDFSAAIKRARARVDDQVEAALSHRARGYSHRAVKIFNHEGTPLVVDYTEHYPPDTRAAEIWLHCRRPEPWAKKEDAKIAPEDAARKVREQLSQMDATTEGDDK
jgi:hypothetical protein